MRAIVLGAGVVGVTTAYYLSRRGYRVTVVDRATDVASATSHANGGQLSYGFADALATPAFARKIPALLAGRNFATRIRITPGLIPWGLRFFAQCTSKRARATSIKMLNLARRSAELMSELQQQVDIDFSFRPAGKIVLLSKDDELRAAERDTAFKRSLGFDMRILSRAEAESIEPAIAGYQGTVRAAVYSESDDIADARRFAAGLRKNLEQKQNVTFQLGTVVDSLLLSNGRITGVNLDHKGAKTLSGDVVVICLGAWSGAILKPLGIDPQIYPVRGYSVTLPVGDDPPSASLTSLTNRFVFSRLSDSMRIAGFTDFDGFNTRNDAERVATLLNAAKQLAPGFALYDCEDIKAWGGFRPMTPSGIPLVGPSKIPGLYLNTGHGMLGWTLACATAHSVVESTEEPNERSSFSSTTF